MDHFNYRSGELFAENVAVEDIARRFGTPAYVYSRATLERHYRAYDDALAGRPHLVCYAVKANSNIAVLNVLARLGAGFDIVSAGELERVIRAGGDPAKTVFSGVGKQRWEMRRALEAGVRCFNVESDTELDRLNEELLLKLNDSGDLYLTQNSVRGSYAIRFAVGQTYTQPRHVAAAWQAIQDTARSLSSI